MKPVWIIDDDRSIRWVFEKALMRESIAFRTFASVREALDALETDTPQVLVSDIRMPGESGLQLLQSAKARYPNLPVIIMTAYSDLESAVTAFQGGAYEYLPKPFDVDHAVELIRRAMQESARKNGAVEEVAAAPEILEHRPADAPGGFRRANDGHRLRRENRAQRMLPRMENIMGGFDAMGLNNYLGHRRVRGSRFGKTSPGLPS